jgi:uncharacterized protein YydD (DUF2326 family)
MFHWLRAIGGPFKNLEFVPGFNVILAERSSDASDRATRNATGKSTAINLLHFMLGSDLRPTDPLRSPELEAYEFSLGIDLYGQRVEVRRALATPARVTILGATSEEATRILGSNEAVEISLEQYKRLLANALYGLSNEDLEISGPSPTVRTLLAYAIRRDRVAFGDPFKIFGQQPELNRQANVSFLLGLDWKPINTLGGLKERERHLKALQEAVREGLVPGVDSTDVNESVIFDLEEERQALRGRVDGFQVIDDPQGLVERVDALTARLSTLRDAQYVDQRYVSMFRRALDEIENDEPDVTELDQLYNEAVELFPQVARDRYADAVAFHRQLLSNRRSYMTAEIVKYEQAIQGRTLEIDEISRQRQAGLTILNSGGALDEFAALKDRLNEVDNNLAAITNRRMRADEIRAMAADTRVEQAEIGRTLELTLADGRPKVDAVKREFHRITGSLYDRAGVLAVDATERGYVFGISLDGGASTGVSNMKTVCFDLSIWSCRVEIGLRPDFVVHDSNLFDGVDERQQRGALAAAHEIAASTGGQYICTLNSDDVPTPISEQDWFSGGICVTLSDESESGSLFKTRF